MRFSIWGCRGSVAVPGPTTVRYGGNTSCYMLEADSGEIIIFDAGTGIRELGMKLAAKMPLHIDMMFSHTHYDHVIGYPFFVPFFVPGNKIDLYGPVHFERSFKSVMTEQLDYSFFPVRMDELRASLKFHDLREESLDVGPFKVRTMYANHPITALAFRVEIDGKVCIYTGDTEPYINHLEGDPDADEEEFEEVREVIAEQKARWIDFIKGADLCLHDAQYTPEEYPKFKGWGHTAMNTAIDQCAEAGVKKILLSHHNPTRTDDDLDKLFPRWQQYVAEKNYSIEVAFAVEGQAYQI